MKDFLESRGGLLTLWRRFADEEVPRRNAWLYTLGSLALLAFLVQLLTGIALALYYAPTPDHAHESVRRIEALPGGSLVRGLHHWGTSAMVLAVLVHLLRTFFSGAYKKPRELNWLSGVLLLLLVLGFGFTGYLLPWDQKAYWATVVGTKAPAAMPVLGPFVEKLLAGGGTVGAYTLTRFFTLHVILLPLLTLSLVGAHLALLRRHGHAGPAAGPDPRQPFFPYQAARDAAAGLALVVVLFWLAARHPAPLEPLADPTDTSYVPRPDWYFLPLFQLLKYFTGPLEPVGTALLPGVAVLLLALVPWLDRAKERRWAARKLVLAAGTFSAAAALVLLALGAADRPSVPLRSALGPGSEPPPDPKLLGGAASYSRRGCASCHGPEGRGGAAAKEGFALAGRKLSLGEERIASHAKQATPASTVPVSESDPDKDLPSLQAYCLALEAGPVELGRVAAALRLGGAAIDREECRTCHTILGEGGRRGPALVHVSSRHEKSWLVGHFKEPKKFVPGSKMPSFRDLPGEELSAMADYLLALP